MILQRYITQWKEQAPWPYFDQIEHDLILSRALCELYAIPSLKENLLFRGGTALHKLFFKEPGRFSEDLDFVQKEAKPIGDIITLIRECIDPWLGQPKWKQGQGRFTLYYRFKTEIEPIVQRKLKIEINTREHFNILPLKEVNFSVNSEWYKGSAVISTYQLEELLATKLRALYQRRKGRDLFDFWYANKMIKHINFRDVVNIFLAYMKKNEAPITYPQYVENIERKRESGVFNDDMTLLLSPKLSSYHAKEAYELLFDKIIFNMKD